MKQALPFHSYNGAEPYLFVSYAHKDAPRVYPLLRALHGQHCRIWYDEGIEIGANWPQTVAERLRGAALVVVFASAHTALSQNCRREINYAVSQRKNLLVVDLDGAELPPDMAMQLSVAPRIDARGEADLAAALEARLDDSLRGDGVSGYGESEPARKKPVNGWFFASLALTLLLIAAALGFYGTVAGWFGGGQAVRREVIQSEEHGEITVTSFNSELSLELLLRALDSDCAWLCGSRIVSDAAAIARSEDGWTVAGEPAERGTLSSLAPFAGLGLTQLALVNESIESLEGIEELPELQYLDLSDNPIGDLTPLTELMQLRELRLAALPEGVSLAPLARIGSLRRVWVSYDMIDRIAPLLEAEIEVVVTK